MGVLEQRGKGRGAWMMAKMYGKAWPVWRSGEARTKTMGVVVCRSHAGRIKRGRGM